jgi:hypothetical protein
MKTLIVRLTKPTTDISSKRHFPVEENGNISFKTQLVCGYKGAHGFFTPSLKDSTQIQITGALFADEVHDVDIYYIEVSDEFYNKVHNANNLPAEKNIIDCYRDYLHAEKFRSFEFEISPDEFKLLAKSEFNGGYDSMHTTLYVEKPKRMLDRIIFYESLNYDSRFIDDSRVSESVDLTQLEIESTQLAAAYYSVTNALMN